MNHGHKTQTNATRKTQNTKPRDKEKEVTALLIVIMNDNQNAFVTRSTSRVLSEPGGKSSLGYLFGGGPAQAPTLAAEKPVDTEKEVLAKEVIVEEKNETNEMKTTTTASGAAPDATNDAISEAARIKKKNESQQFSIFGATNIATAPPEPESSNAFASSATTNSYNVLTDRPSSRVLRPPGGHSSIKLG